LLIPPVYNSKLAEFDGLKMCIEVISLFRTLIFAIVHLQLGEVLSNKFIQPHFLIHLLVEFSLEFCPGIRYIPFASEVSSPPVNERTFSLLKLTFGKPSAVLRLRILSIDAFALHLFFGSKENQFWGSHPDSCVPCPAHTAEIATGCRLSL